MLYHPAFPTFYWMLKITLSSPLPPQKINKKSFHKLSEPSCACVHVRKREGVTNNIMDVFCVYAVCTDTFGKVSRSPCGTARMPRWEQAALEDPVTGWEQRDAPYLLDLAGRSCCHQTSMSHNRSFCHYRHSLESPPRNESMNTPPWNRRGERGGKLTILRN